MLEMGNKCNAFFFSPDIPCLHIGRIKLHLRKEETKEGEKSCKSNLNIIEGERDMIEFNKRDPGSFFHGWWVGGVIIGGRVDRQGTCVCVGGVWVSQRMGEERFFGGRRKVRELEDPDI